MNAYTINPGDNSWEPVGELGELTVYDPTASHELVDRACEAEIILMSKMPLSAETLRQPPKLRFISVTATGYNLVDKDDLRLAYLESKK